VAAAPALASDEGASSEEDRTSTGAPASPASSSEGVRRSKAVPDVDGWWAQKMVLTAVSDPPFVGEVTNETINYLLVRVDQQGRDLTLYNQVCDVDIDSSFTKVRTIIPDAFAEALPDSQRSGELVRRDGRWRVQVDRLLSVVGAQLREPTSERLPTSTDDPRVVDADEDGNPGLTVKIRGMVNGELYVVQRGWDTYSGLVASRERIRGDVRWSTEQTVLGSNNMFLRSQPPTEPHDNPDRSFFEMIRLDGTPSCDDVSPGLFKG
jgi:hypothetical protein